MNKISKVFAVHDAKGEAFSPPVSFDTVGLALRWFEGMANDPQTNIYKNPEDYSMFYIGTYDCTLGVLACDNHMPVSRGIDAKKQQVIDSRQGVISAVGR